jgi:hypothetical protein
MIAGQISFESKVYRYVCTCAWQEIGMKHTGDVEKPQEA